MEIVAQERHFRPFPRRLSQPADQLETLGWLLILIGGFHLFFSAMGLLHFGLQSPPFGLGSIQPGSPEPGEFAFGLLPGRGLIALYVVAQIGLGWILGLATMWAGFETRKAKHRRFVKSMAAANLLFVPLGTTVGAIALIGLNRPQIKAAFARGRP